VVDEPAPLIFMQPYKSSLAAAQAAEFYAVRRVLWATLMALSAILIARWRSRNPCRRSHDLLISRLRLPPPTRTSLADARSVDVGRGAPKADRLRGSRNPAGGRRMEASAMTGDCSSGATSAPRRISSRGSLLDFQGFLSFLRLSRADIAAIWSRVAGGS